MLASLSPDFLPQITFFPLHIFSKEPGGEVGRRKRRSWFSIKITVFASPLMAAIPHSVPKGHQHLQDPDCIQDGGKTEASTAHKILQNIFTHSSTSSNMSLFFPLQDSLQVSARKLAWVCGPYAQHPCAALNCRVTHETSPLSACPRAIVIIIFYLCYNNGQGP